MDAQVGEAVIATESERCASKTITVECLGGFRVTAHGSQITRWKAGRARQLFQYLLAREGQVVHRDRLNELLWPNSDARESTSLKVAVHGLRQVLDAAQRDASANESSHFEVRYSGGGYALETKGVWTDFKELEARIESGRQYERQGRPDQARLAYQRGVELNTGDFLPGEHDYWVIEQREWLRDLVMWALDWLSSTALSQHDYLDAIAWSRQIIEIDPYREHAYQRLMVCYARLGQLERVKCWRDRCVHRLGQELGVRPQRATFEILREAMDDRPAEVYWSAAEVPLQGHAR